MVPFWYKEMVNNCVIYLRVWKSSLEARNIGIRTYFHAKFIKVSYPGPILNQNQGLSGVSGEQLPYACFASQEEAHFRSGINEFGGSGGNPASVRRC